VSDRRCIYRYAYGDQEVDPVDESIRDLLHWCRAVLLQGKRLTKSIRAEMKAWESKPGLRSERRFSATTYDEHMLAVAGAHLDKAIHRAKKPVRQMVNISSHSLGVLKLLRNIYEHWEESRAQYRQSPTNRSRALARLSQQFPHAEPWMLVIDHPGGEITPANAVRLTPLLEELKLLERDLLRLRRSRERRTSRAGGPTSRWPDDS